MAKKRIAPTTVPAIAAIDIPPPPPPPPEFSSSLLPVGGGEDSDSVGDVAVGGAVAVLEGELLLRQLLSSDEATLRISVAPPMRPVESNMANNICVPDAMLAVH